MPAIRSPFRNTFQEFRITSTQHSCIHWIITFTLLKVHALFLYVHLIWLLFGISTPIFLPFWRRQVLAIWPNCYGSAPCLRTLPLTGHNVEGTRDRNRRCLWLAPRTHLLLQGPTVLEVW
jgi:hypothetical protein